jgi:hypothetical protein
MGVGVECWSSWVLEGGWNAGVGICECLNVWVFECWELEYRAFEFMV